MTFDEMYNYAYNTKNLLQVTEMNELLKVCRAKFPDTKLGDLEVICSWVCMDEGGVDAGYIYGQQFK